MGEQSVWAGVIVASITAEPSFETKPACCRGKKAGTYKLHALVSSKPRAAYMRCCPQAAYVRGVRLPSLLSTVACLHFPHALGGRGAAVRFATAAVHADGVQVVGKAHNEQTSKRCARSQTARRPWRTCSLWWRCPARSPLAAVHAGGMHVVGVGVKQTRRPLESCRRSCARVRARLGLPAQRASCAASTNTVITADHYKYSEAKQGLLGGETWCTLVQIHVCAAAPAIPASTSTLPAAAIVSTVPAAAIVFSTTGGGL